jgi:hypothetical protein
MSSIEFTLKFPFEYKGVTHSRFEMRRPKVRDLKLFSIELDRDPVGAMEKVIGQLVEQTDATISEMDLVDFNPMKRAFEGFLEEMASDKNKMTGNSIELKYPFEFGNAKYTRFDMRRPKVRDLKKFSRELESDPIGAMEKALGDLTDTPESVIGDLDLSDFGPMKKRFEDFLNEMANESNAS